MRMSLSVLREDWSSLRAFWKLSTSISTTLSGMRRLVVESLATVLATTDASFGAYCSLCCTDDIVSVVRAEAGIALTLGRRRSI